MSNFISNWLTEISSSAQLWLICRPNFLSRCILSFFYIIDTFIFQDDTHIQLQSHSAVMGANFAALGRIVVGDYDIVADIISNPQKRGNYLGRTRLDTNKMPENFPLFVSDEEEGGGTLHGVLNDNFWALVQSAVDRVNANSTDYTNYVNQGVEEYKNATDEKDMNIALQKLTVRYVIQALFDIVLTDEQVDLWNDLTNAPDPRVNYLGGAWDPFSTLFHLFQGTRTSLSEEARDMLLESPVLKDYVPSESNANMTKIEYCELLVPLTTIAGTFGSLSLLKAINLIPDDAVIDFTDEVQVTYAVLEAARLFPPVFNANAISTSERTLEVNGKLHTIPSNTVFMYSIALASLDPEMYEDPYTFNHMRENLTETALLFNHIGFDPEKSGRRNCPGRNLAVKLGRTFLVTLRGS